MRRKLLRYNRSTDIEPEWGLAAAPKIGPDQKLFRIPREPYGIMFAGNP
jgi:hypothetical protein